MPREDPSMTESAANSFSPVSARPLAKISLKWGMVEEPSLSILEKFQLLRDLGYDGVELDAPNDLPLDEVLNARDKTGLAIPGFVNAVHWKRPLTDPDPSARQACVDLMIKALHDAKLYGATTVLLVPGIVNAGTSYKTAYARAREEIARILPAAEESGVSIALENVWNDFLLSPLRRRISSIASAIRSSAGISMSAMYFATAGRPIDRGARQTHPENRHQGIQPGKDEQRRPMEGLRCRTGRGRLRLGRGQQGPV